MYRVDVHNFVKRIMSTFQLIGWWDSDGQTKWSNLRKLCLFVIFVSFCVALGVGVINKDDSFLAVVALSATVQIFKLYYIIWRSSDVRHFIYSVGSFELDSREDFDHVNGQVKRFARVMNTFLIYTVVPVIVAALFSAVANLLGKQKFLLCNVSFPLDWNHTELGFWMAFVFVYLNCFYAITSIQLDVIVWYVMMGFTTRLQLIGNNFRRLGKPLVSWQLVTDKHLISIFEKHKQVKR